ncbi:hypothetical protein [Streptomyces sp. NPDC093600]|uniref:hypothetical protein n=1 Tax=Streptomyces sp. NPDC093600 TaxID=3366047 RepID=UPI0037F18DD7
MSDEVDTVGTAVLLAAAPTGRGRAMDAASVLPALAAVPPSALTGTPSATVVELADPLDPQTVLTRLRAAAAMPGPMAVYLAGQVHLDRRQHLPHLALARTTSTTLRYTGLPWHWLAAELAVRGPGTTTVVADLVVEAELWQRLTATPGLLSLGPGPLLYGRVAPAPRRGEPATPEYLRTFATIWRTGARPPLAQLHEEAAAHTAGGDALLLAPTGAGAWGASAPVRVPAGPVGIGGGAPAASLGVAAGSLPAAGAPLGVAAGSLPAAPIRSAPTVTEQTASAGDSRTGAAPSGPLVAAVAPSAWPPPAGLPGSGAPAGSLMDGAAPSGAPGVATPPVVPPVGASASVVVAGPGISSAPLGASGTPVVSSDGATPSAVPPAGASASVGASSAPLGASSASGGLADRVVPTVPSGATAAVGASVPMAPAGTAPTEARPSDRRGPAAPTGAWPTPSGAAGPGPVVPPVPSGTWGPSGQGGAAIAPGGGPSRAPATPSHMIALPTEPAPTTSPSSRSPHGTGGQDGAPAVAPAHDPHREILAAAQAGRHGEAIAVAAAWEREALRRYGARSQEAVHWMEVRADLARLAGEPARSCELWIAAAQARLGLRQGPGDPDVEGAVDRAHHQWEQIQDPARARELGPALIALRRQVPGRQPGALAALQRRMR